MFTVINKRMRKSQTMLVKQNRRTRIIVYVNVYVSFQTRIHLGESKIGLGQCRIEILIWSKSSPIGRILDWTLTYIYGSII